MIALSRRGRAQARGGASGGSGRQNTPPPGAAAPFATLARAGEKKQRRIAAALRAFLDAPAPARKAVAPGAPDPLLAVQFDGSTDRAASRAEGYTRQVRQLRELQANPQLLVERLARSAGPLTAAAPDVSLAMQANTKTRLDFLLSKVPSPPGSWAAEFPAAGTSAGERARPPSDAELARWSRYVQAVQDPLSTLEGLAEGRVPAEAAETLRTVYPALYGEMQRQLFQALTEHLAGGQTLSVPQRRALSRLLGVPVDRLTAPDFGHMLQQSFAQERAQMRQPPRPAPRRAAQGGRHPITLQTPVQRIENR